MRSAQGSKNARCAGAVGPRKWCSLRVTSCAPAGSASSPAAPPSAAAIAVRVILLIMVGSPPFAVVRMLRAGALAGSLGQSDPNSKPPPKSRQHEV
ncbi:MAG: hypothetical protein K0R41_3334 [Geminicoccaceae bacterium]|nr:hypothetical protein [Geminicoccaceae bacterium]